MEFFKGEDNLGGVEFGSELGRDLLVFSEAVFEEEEVEELASGTVV
jgi:hypothetical protein